MKGRNIVIGFVIAFLLVVAWGLYSLPYQEPSPSAHVLLGPQPIGLSGLSELPGVGDLHLWGADGQKLEALSLKGKAVSAYSGGTLFLELPGENYLTIMNADSSIYGPIGSRNGSTIVGEVPRVDSGDEILVWIYKDEDGLRVYSIKILS